MAKLNRFVSAVMVFALIVVSSVCIIPSEKVYAKEVISAFKDDFDSYTAQSDIVSFSAINSKTIPNDGKMTPADGYKWAERYNSDNNEFGSGYGLYPMTDPNTNESIGYLYNYGTSQFYRISSKAVTGASNNNIVVSGRFCIPDINGIGGFDFGIVPNERYSSKVFESFCNLVTVNSSGELYKSVKDDTATYGASNELIDNVTIESNVWYNVLFVADNSTARNYKGRLFTDDGTVDIAIADGYLAQTTSYGDDTGDKLRVGLRLGKASSSTASNHVFVDDMAISVTDYGYENAVPETAGVATVTAIDETTVNIDIDTPFSVYDVNENTIKVVDSTGVEFDVTSVTSNDDGSIDAVLASEMTDGGEYTIEINANDIFLNKITSGKSFVYVAPEIVPEVFDDTVYEGFKDDFGSYTAQSDIVSFTAISAGLSGQGRMIPAEGYNWAERYNSDGVEFGTGNSFFPMTDPNTDEPIGYLYNYSTSQFYGVSTKMMSNANTKNIVASGRFYIPAVDEINNFSFSLVPTSHRSSTDLWPNCPLITVKTNGAVYKSVKDADATFGASDYLLEGVTVESGKWYNVAFIIENSDSRKYKGRLFSDDASIDVDISGYLGQLTCSWDTSASKVGLGLVMGKAPTSASANHVFVDDLAIYTTGYGYSRDIPKTIREATVTAVDATTVNIDVDTPVSVYDINENTIKITDASGNIINVDYVTANDDGTIDATLVSELADGGEYTVEISGKDVFMNEITSGKSFVYVALEIEPEVFDDTVYEGFKDDFGSYTAQSDIISFTAISAGLSGQGRMIPSSGYNWAERYNSDGVEFGAGSSFFPIADPNTEDPIGYLYNNSTTQYYGVSTNMVTNANTRNIVVSGRFCIPAIDEINSFSISLTPYSHYNASNYWPSCPLITIKNGGTVYRSVKDSAISSGASDELVVGVAVESNNWYNVTFIVENSASRNYKGRLFSDDGTVDIDISGYLPQLTCSWDTSATRVELGIVMGKAISEGSENYAFVDDMAIYTTGYGYSRDIPKTEREATVTAVDATTVNIDMDSPFSVYDVNENTIKILDSKGNAVDISAVSAKDNGTMDVTLSTALVKGEEYSVEISGKDVFLNNINVVDTVIYGGIDIQSVVFAQNGEAVAQLQNGTVTCNMVLTNTTTNTPDGILILALYKGNSLIKTTIADPVSIASGTTTTLNASLDCTIDGDVSAYYLKAFVINSKNNIMPVVKNVIFGK